MRTFNSFSEWLEFVDSGNKLTQGRKLVTFDFDETLTRWGHDGGFWVQIPNEKNISTYLRKHVQEGDVCSIVTFRNPALAKDPRFKLYTKIEPYLHAWGLEEYIENVIYTRLGPKPPYILSMAKHKNIPFYRHYDDDATHTEAVQNSKELRKIASWPNTILGFQLPYEGPRPPAPSITPAGMAKVKL